MELNFEELNDTDTTLVTDTSFTTLDTNNNSINYWENKNTSTTQKKPRVSYDDILSSLNMVVQNGVLKFANPNTNVRTNVKTNIKNTNSNNFITNKYFKDYKEEPEPLETKPLTKEQQKELYIKRQQELKHISEVKSKKLLFNTQNINIAPRQNANLNKLFPMFKR